MQRTRVRVFPLEGTACAKAKRQGRTWQCDWNLVWASRCDMMTDREGRPDCVGPCKEFVFLSKCDREPLVVLSRGVM